MAGLWGLTVLLLCAGIIALANCNNGTQSANPADQATAANKTANHATSASTSPSPPPSPTPSKTLDSQANTTQSQNLPPSSMSNTTVNATTALSPARTSQNSTLPSVTSLLITSSTPRTMTTTTVMSSDAPTAAHKPTLTPPTLTSNSSIQAPNATNMSATHAPPASTSPSPSPTPPPTPSKTLDSQANTTQSQTLPPTTMSITTVNATTATTPVPPQCSYTVKAIKFGFQIAMINSTTGNYKINIKEKDGPETEEKPTVHSFIQNSTHEIKHLKPCTDYELNVAVIDSTDKETSCNHTENKTQTNGMSEGDIRDESCMPGYVCYRSDWDISSSLSNNISAEKCTNDNTVFCIKLGYDDICTDLTTTFTSGNCSDSFKLTTSITVDFLNPSEINQMFPNELPVKAEARKPELPPNCSNLTIDYTCQENGKPNDTKELSELEPYTDYSCTGQIKDNNVTIENKKTDITFRVDCDLKININKNATDTSIHLEWNTTSNNCQDVVLQKLSYHCSSTASNQKPGSPTNKLPSGGTCDITGLEPFQPYTCVVQPKYNDRNVPNPQTVTVKTASGKPDAIDTLTVTVPEQNVIRVTCGYVGKKRFKGPDGKYNASLLYDGVIQKKQTNTKCEFEFKDLSYSTEYKVEVIAFNGHLHSNPKRESVTTKYNDKALIGFLVFLTIFAFVALVVAAYKIYHYKKSKNVVRGDMMLEPTEIC